jgi:hypothetical protein
VADRRDDGVTLGGVIEQADQVGVGGEVPHGAVAADKVDSVEAAHVRDVAEAGGAGQQTVRG